MKKDFWKKVAVTILILIFVRILAHVPIPGIKTDALKIAMNQYAGSAFYLLNQMTGNAFQNMTLTGLGISPYITATIIVQLLTVSFDRLGNLSRDGYYGRKKIEHLNIGLGIFMSIAIAFTSSIALSKMGYLVYNNVFHICVVTFALCLGAVILIGVGKLIDKKGIGNGISLILFVNIVATFPNDIQMVILSKPKLKIIICSMTAIIIGLIVFMELTRKEIKIYNTTTIKKNKQSDRFSKFPIKLGICNVMPIIFVSTIMQMFSLIALISHHNKVLKEITSVFNTGNWFVSMKPTAIIGIIFYCVIIALSAFLYADIIMNPAEISVALKANRCMIENIRPGNDTVTYIRKTRRGMIIGNILILIIASITPMIITNVLKISLQMSGTSLIIAIGVLIETQKAFYADYLGTKYQKKWLN